MSDNETLATPEAVVFSRITALLATHFVDEVALLANDLGVYISVPSLLAAVLASAWENSEPVTREDIAGVYDRVATKLAPLGYPAPGLPAEQLTQRINEAVFGLPDLHTRLADDSSNG